MLTDERDTLIQERDYYKARYNELSKIVEELTDEQGYWGGSDLLEQIKVLEEILEKEQ